MLLKFPCPVHSSQPHLLLPLPRSPYSGRIVPGTVQGPIARGGHYLPPCIVQSRLCISPSNCKSVTPVKSICRLGRDGRLSEMIVEVFPPGPPCHTIQLSYLWKLSPTIRVWITFPQLLDLSRINTPLPHSISFRSLSGMRLTPGPVDADQFPQVDLDLCRSDEQEV